MGRGVSPTVREDLKAEKRRVIILSLEQPVVGLEPDRSDPRMRLKQNWSFLKVQRHLILAQRGGSVDCRVELARLWGNLRIVPGRSRTARVGNESNQVS